MYTLSLHDALPILQLVYSFDLHTPSGSDLKTGENELFKAISSISVIHFWILLTASEVLLPREINALFIILSLLAVLFFSLYQRLKLLHLHADVLKLSL